MTESRTGRELVFDRSLDDTDDSDGWYGHASPAESTHVHQVGELERDDSQDAWLDDADTDRWYMPWHAISGPRDGYGDAGIGEWTFTAPRAEPWYRSKRAKRGSHRSGSAGDRGAARTTRGAQLCGGHRGIHHGAIPGAHEFPACAHQSCAGDVPRDTAATCAAATPFAAARSAATTSRCQPRTGHHSAVSAATPVATKANEQAGDRGDSHTCHPQADQCDTARTATAPTQLQHPRRLTRRLGLVTNGRDTQRRVRGAPETYIGQDNVMDGRSAASARVR